MTPHRFRAMGCEVVVGGATAGEAVAVERLFETLERSLSRFLPFSDLERLNGSSAPAAVVSPVLATAIDDALRAAEATDGICDPTVGAAVVAAGYDRTFFDLVPGPRNAPVPAGRWREVRLSGLLVRRPAGLLLDLNGVVKGRAVDDALALLEGPGFVSAGGDLAARGDLVVALPGEDTVTLHGGALATSGVSSRSWERADGSRAHHLIDPRTGAPSTSPWECVTVCAATCLAADVAAKTAFLLGDDGPAWIEARGLQARFLSPDGIVLACGWPGAPAEISCT